MAVPPPSANALPGDPAKPALRARLKDRRHRHAASLGESGRARAAAAAAAHLLPRVPEGAIVGLYLAMAGELDPAPLAALLHARGQRLAMPHLDDLRTMRFRAWAPGDPVERGPMRLRQPLPVAAELAPDLIVTPLLGFDRAGGRIGHGAGHYDRAFALFPGAYRVGFAWGVQEEEGIPHDPWDVPLHAVASEAAFLACAAPGDD